ncbi:MAG: glycosyltransferase family 4 protein, partial [Chloroflexota bacterium]
VFHGYFSPAKTRAFLEIERALARASTRIIALGDVQRQELLEYGVGAPAKVVSIPLGFELSPFLQAEKTRGRLRAELGLAGSNPASTPLLGMIGRLVPIKRVDIFLAAAARILAAAPDARFVLVGDGELRGELEALAARPPLAGHVHFLGWRGPADLPGLFADLDAVVLTSDNEGMPTTIIEAMAAARPVVATDVGGVRSLVTDGETGLLVPPGDPAAVADACLRLLRDPQSQREMGAAGRRAAYPRYHVSTLLTTMTEFYTSLATRSGD